MVNPICNQSPSGKGGQNKRLEMITAEDVPKTDKNYKATDPRNPTNCRQDKHKEKNIKAIIIMLLKTSNEKKILKTAKMKRNITFNKKDKKQPLKTMQAIK